MKVYIVAEVNWEYDDNYYYLEDPEFPSVVPRQTFSSLKEAQEECHKKNINTFKEVFQKRLLGGWGSSPSFTIQTSIFEYFSDDVPETLTKVFDELGISYNVNSYTGGMLPDNIEDKDIEKLIIAGDLYFYTVLEIEQ